MKSETYIPFFLISRYLRNGNKWTLVLIIFLMAIAFVNLVFVSSLFNGIIENSNQQIIDTYTGHIMITPKQGNDFIEDVAEKLEMIKSTPGISGASAQMAVTGSLKYHNIKGVWQISAINPKNEEDVTVINEKMIEGEFLNSSDTDKIIIGRQIAGGEDVEMDAFSFKDAAVGDTVTLSYDGVSKEFIIKGIFYTKFLDTDQRAFITSAAAREINPNFNNRATSILVRIENEGEEEEIISTLQAAGIDEHFISWKDAAGLMTSVTKSFLSINVLLSTVGVLIAAVTIFIVIYIDISNKRQQIGILRAIGIKPYLIHATYVIQTSVYSVAGVILGAVFFFGVAVPYFNAYPFELPIGDATLAMNPADLIIRAEAIMIVALFAGLIPAIIVTRIKILEAIWGSR